MDHLTQEALAEVFERINIAGDAEEAVSMSAYSKRADISVLGACCEVLKEYIENTAEMLDGIMSGAKLTERKAD